MFIQINDNVVIDSADITNIKKQDIDGPLNPTGWFVYTKDGKGYRLITHSFEKFMELINKEN